MKIMKVVVFWVGVLVLVTSAAGAASGVPAAAEPQKARGRAAQIKRGRTVYADRCARCHGADGQGQTRLGEMIGPPDLSDPVFQGALSDARMIAAVTNGRAGMPAFKKKLSRQDIAAAVAYVRTLRR